MKNLPVEYHEKTLRVAMEGDDLVNLTDLWKAQGSPESQTPHKWLILPETEQFIDRLQELQKGRKSPFLKSKRGKGGGTYAHWQIALAYAKYLSPELHLVVNQVFKERIEEKDNPELGIERARKRAISIWQGQGRDAAWIATRIDGIPKRIAFTDTLQGHGVRGYGFGRCTNAIYVPLLGGCAKDLKTDLALKKTANLRDNMTQEQLAAVALAEIVAQRLVRDRRAYGNQQCEDASYKAGSEINKALKACV